MSGPADPTGPGVEFRSETTRRRNRPVVAVWIVGLALVAVVAVVGRAIGPPVVVATAEPSIALVTPAATAPTTATAVPSSTGPPLVVLLIPHGPIATLVDDALFVSGTVWPGIDKIDVTVTDSRSTLVGQSSIGSLGGSGEFRADVPIRGVKRTDWLFIEIAAFDGTGTARGRPARGPGSQASTRRPDRRRLLTDARHGSVGRPISDIRATT